jgi:hypothetical protein
MIQQQATGTADQNLNMQPADWAVVPAARWESGRIMEERSGAEGTAEKIMYK